MDCNFLNTNIDNCTAQPARQFKERAYITTRDNLRNIVFSGHSVKFLGGTWYEVIDTRTQPFNGTIIKQVIGEHGSVTSTETVMFPLLESSPNSAEIINMLNAGRVVMILEQVEVGTDDISRWLVCGVQVGLKAAENTFSNSTDGAWVVTLTGERNAVNGTWLYDTDEEGTQDLIDYFVNNEFVNLSIGTGTKKAYLEVDSDKTCYATMPNGTIYTSTSGVINQNYSGGAGRVTLVIPKSGTTTKLNNAGFTIFADFLGNYLCNNSGDLSAAGSKLTSIVVPNKTSISCGGSTLLENLSCPKSTAIYAADCPLLPESVLKRILDDAYTLELANPGNNGTIDLSGSNTSISVESISEIHGISYQDIIESGLADWTIDVNIEI